MERGDDRPEVLGGEPVGLNPLREKIPEGFRRSRASRKNSSVNRFDATVIHGFDGSETTTS